MATHFFCKSHGLGDLKVVVKYICMRNYPINRPNTSLDTTVLRVTDTDVGGDGRML